MVMYRTHPGHTYMYHTKYGTVPLVLSDAWRRGLHTRRDGAACLGSECVGFPSWMRDAGPVLGGSSSKSGAWWNAENALPTLLRRGMHQQQRQSSGRRYHQWSMLDHLPIRR